jgi:hypothetical protein
LDEDGMNSTDQILEFQEDRDSYKGAYVTPLIMLLVFGSMFTWLVFQGLNLFLLAFLPFLIGPGAWLWATLRTKDPKIEKVIVDIENSEVRFENSLIKDGRIGFVRKSTSVKFTDILGVYDRSYRNNKNTLLVSRSGEVLIPDCLSDYKELVSILQGFSKITEDPNMIRRPWIQGLILTTVIVASVVAIVVTFAYFTT